MSRFSLRNLFPLRLNIVTRLILICLAVGIIPLVVISVVGISVSMNTLKEHAARNLQASADLQYKHVENNLKRVVKDAMYLAELPHLMQYLDGFDDRFSDVQKEFLEFNKSNKEYYQVRLLDIKGQEIIRSNFRNDAFFLTAKDDLQFKGTRYYFTEAIKKTKGSVYFSPIDFNIEHGQIETPKQMMLRIAVPVYKDENKSGLIVLNMFADKFFSWLKLPGTPFSSLLLNEQGKILFIEKNGNQYKLSDQIKEGGFISNAFPEFSKERVRPVEGGVEASDSDFIAFHTMKGTGNFNHPKWFLFTFFPKSYFQPQLNLFTLNLVIAIIAAALICLLSAIYLARRVTGPLRQLYKEMNLVAEGELDHALQMKTGDEIEDLAEKFDRMRIQLRNRLKTVIESNNKLKVKVEKHHSIVRNLERQLYRADKLASLGELSMKLAHEIGNPLASIKTVAQAISEDIEDGQTKTRNFDKIVLEVDRLNNFLKKFNNFAVIKGTEALPCDMKELVRDVNFFLRIQAKEQEVSIKEYFDQDIEKINVDPQQIKQALVNLLLNSIQASGQQSEIRVSLRNTNGKCEGCDARMSCFCMDSGHPPASGNFMELSICDTGEGIDEENLIKVFDPFFTTKENGTGLGLSVVHRIVEQHRGTIRVFSKKGSGTTFRIFLPKPNNGNSS